MSGWDKVARATVTRVLARAGIEVGGPAPWDITVHDERFYGRVLQGGSLGIGESYVDGQWDCPKIDQLVGRVLAEGADDEVPDWQKALLLARASVFNLQSVFRARQVAEVHYDLGNELFEKMLGPTMNYSCGYWASASDLDGAQTAKMDLICRKLGLGPGQRLLDIGSGWGGLLRHAVDHFGCSGVGITVSAPQCEYARARTAGRDLRFLVADYRSDEVRRMGPFDKVVSVGMFEHVGQKNYRTFMEVARGLLRDDGLFLLHTIGNDHSPTDPWLNRYIFPNGMLPSTADMASALEGLFVMEDWHNLRADYHRTVVAWADRFEAHAAELGVSERFHRMWRYYLLTMAGCFLAGSRNQLWQIVLSKRGVREGYRAPR